MGSPLKGLFDGPAIGSLPRTGTRTSIFWNPPGAAPAPVPEEESYIGRASRYLNNAQDFISGPKQAIDLGVGLGADYLKNRGIDLGIDTDRGNEAGQLLMNTVGLKAPGKEYLESFRKVAPAALVPFAEAGQGITEGAIEKTGALATDPTLALIPESRAIGAAFLPGILRGAGEQLGEAGAQFGAGNYREAARHAAGGLVDTGFGLLAGTHTFGGRGVGIEDANRVAGTVPTEGTTAPNTGTLRRPEFVEGATVQPEGTPAPDLGYGRGGVPVNRPNPLAKGVDLTVEESARIQQALAQAQAQQQAPLEQPGAPPVGAPVQPLPRSTPGGQSVPVDNISGRDTAEVGRLARMLPEMADEGLAQRLAFYESKGLAQSADAVRGEIQRRQTPAPQPVVAEPMAEPGIAQDATQTQGTTPDTSVPPIVEPEPNAGPVAGPTVGEQQANAPSGIEAVLSRLPPEERAVVEQEIHKARTTDPLTGLKNRAGWKELAESLGDNDHATVIDLKGFKEVNDTYGHDAADEILRSVGGLMRRHFGEESSRHGGDEFGAVIRGGSLEDAQARVDAFNSDLAATTHTLEGPNGERIDIPAVRAHIGLTRGRDAARSADLAANAHRNEQGSGRRSTDRPDVPDLPRSNTGAAALPEAGLPDRSPELASVPQDAEQPPFRNNYPPEAQIAAEVEAAVPSAITALSGRGGEKGGKVWAGTEHVGTLAPGMHPAKVEYGLEDFKEGASTIAAALKRDKGNPLEMRARAAMGARFAEEMAQRGDAHEPAGGDASFNPDEFGETKYSVKSRGVPPAKGPGNNAAEPTRAPGGGFTDHEDAYGSYRKIGDAIDTSGNWKRLKELPEDAKVVFYHATSMENARRIVRDGYKAVKNTWSDTPPDYVYMGGRNGLGTYLGPHGGEASGRGAFVAFEVTKRDLQPDRGTDWKSWLKQPNNRKFAKDYGIDAANPSAADTFAAINQVRAHQSAVRPLGIVDPKSGEFVNSESAHSSPVSGETQYAVTQKTKAGEQTVIPGSLGMNENVPLKTEGREAEGPLFKQDEAARLKAEKESQGRLFKAGQPVAGAAVTTDHVRSAFPKADITESDNGWTVKLPGDRTIRIDQRGEIAYQPEAFEAGYGRKLKEGEEQIVGSFNRIGRDAIIQLAKGADAGTLSHESFHAAMDLALTPKEREAVLRHYKNEEAAADAYAKWRPSTPNTLFSKIVSFFRNIYRSFKPSWESAFEATRSGKAFERAAESESAAPKYAVTQGNFGERSERRQGEADARARDEHLARELTPEEDAALTEPERLERNRAQARRGENIDFDEGISLEADVDWRGGAVTRLVGEGGKDGQYTVRARDGSYSDERFDTPEGAEIALRRARNQPKYATAPKAPPQAEAGKRIEEILQQYGSKRPKAIEQELVRLRAVRDSASPAESPKEAVLRAIREENPRAETMGALTYMPNVRARAGLPPEVFDEAVRSLREDGQVHTQSHPVPSSLTPEEKAAMVVETKRGMYQRAVQQGRITQEQADKAIATGTKYPDELDYHMAIGLLGRDNSQGQVKYATAPKTPPQMPRKLAPIPDKPKAEEKPLGRPMLPEEAHRVDTKVANLKEVAPNVKLSRDAPRTWESLDPEIRKRLDDIQSDPKKETALYEAARKGKISDAEGQTLEALVAGKRESYETIRHRLLKAQEAGRETGPENTAYLQAALDKATSELAFAAKSDVEAGTKLARALAARARVMQAAGKSTPDQFLKRVFREIPDVTEAQAAGLLKIMQERPQDLGDALIHAMNPSTFDKFLEAWKAGLVSAPGTQVANVLGNIGEQVVRLGETATAPLVDALIGGQKTRLRGEARFEFGGAMSGVSKSLGRLSQDLRDIVHLAPESIEISNLDRAPKIGGKTGRAIRVPFRLLSAFDDFFKGVGGEAELHKLAWREAKGDKAAALKLIADPTPEMLEKISASRLSRTFQDPNAAASAIINFRSNQKWAHIVAPFVSTPSNIARVTWQRSPAGFYEGFKALSKYREALAKGGDVAEIAKLKGEAVDKLARPLVGTAIMTSFYAVAKAGGMTGSGPVDAKDRNVLRDGGWQPYSFVVPVAGGKHLYLPFNRFEPVSSILGIAADAAEASNSKSAGDLFDKGLGSLVQNFTSKTYLQGIADAAAAINDPRQFMSQYASNLAGSLVPNVVSKVAQTIDPTLRETKATTSGPLGIPERIAKTLASRIPGASLALNAKKGSTGEDIVRPGNVATRLLSPVQPSVEKDDADVRKALVDLDAVPPVPNREITVKGSKIRLNEEEYATLTKAASLAYSRTKAVLRNPQFAKMGDEDQRNYIKDIFNRYERDARKRLYAIPSFRMRAVEARRAVLAQTKQRSA